MDWGSIAAAAGVGAVHGFQTHKQETKEKEQLDYDRGRQAVQDQQQAKLHEQTVKQNDYTLENNARAQAEAKRKELLSQRLGQYQNFKTMGDINNAAKYYVEFANQDNVGNPNFDQNQALAYTLNDDGTANINIVDKNTGALVRTAREKVGYDDFISATYQQLDPTKSYETQVDNQAKSALETQKQQWELQKLGVQYGYDVGKENNKHNNTIELEGIRQGGANYRAELGQDGANYRSELSFYGKNGGAGGTGGTGSGKASKAVESGVQGAISFAQQNAPMLSFLSNNPDLYTKTIAMMGIESGGAAVPSYDNSSYGHMQLNKKYAHGFARQFGIQGDPINDVQTNIRTGAALINHLNGKYGGDTALIAAAYNAGEPAVDAAVKRWRAAGSQGHWFDHLNLKAEAKQQVYGHITKYNQALGLLGGNTSYLPPEQREQAQADQKAQATANYSKGMGKQITATVNNVASSMTTELDLGTKTSAVVIGGLSGVQTHVAKFASSPDRQERLVAYDNILKTVQQVVDSTEIGMTMTPAAKKEYVHQKAAELVGAANKVEAGAWINRGMNPAKGKVEQKSNLSGNEINNVFDEVNVSSLTNQNSNAADKKSGGQAFIPMRNPMGSQGLSNAASSFKPPAGSNKPAPAKKEAPKPKYVADREKRKAEQIKAMEQRMEKEKSEKEKGKSKPAPKPAPKMLPPPNMMGGSYLSASEALKKKLLQQQK